MVRVFRHYIPLRVLFLASIEGLLFFLVVATTAGATGVAFSDDIPRSSAPLTVAAAITFAVLLVMVSLGMFSRDTLLRTNSMLARAIVAFPLAFVLVTIIEAFVSTLSGNDVLSFGMTAGGILQCAVIALGMHVVFRKVLSGRSFNRRVLVIGTARLAAKVAEAARAGSGQFAVVGYVGGLESEVDGTLGPVYPMNRLDNPDAALRFVRENDVDEIVVATRERRGLPLPSLMECRLRGIPIHDFAAFCESEQRHLDIDETQASALVFNDGFCMNRGRLMVKAMFDYLMASLLLLVTLPVTLPVAVAIKLSSPGPVFYFQERVGRDGRPFRVVKFRSMRTDAEKNGPQWAAADDDRVTGVGGLIRKVRIDEIPQVINVLRGEMSFVGPRPERPLFVDMLRRQIPFYDARHRVLPGITGWAQINYPYGASVDDARHKHAYDLYYVKNGGLFLDLVILFQTARVVLFRSGAR